MRIGIGLFIICFFFGAAGAQGPDPVWTRTYSPFAPGQQTFFAIDTAAGGGFICAGYVAGAGGYDFLALRLNSAGDTLWRRVINSGSDDIAYSCRQTSDGGFV